MEHELLNKSKAKHAIQYRSNSRNKAKHQSIKREMDMIEWERAGNVKLEDTFSDGRVRILARNTKSQLIDLLRKMGYKFNSSKNKVEDNKEIWHRLVFVKENNNWL